MLKSRIGIEALRGVWNIIPTAFSDSGEIDEGGIRSLVEFMIAARVDGITVLGVNGEVTKLTDSERQAVVDAVTTQAAGRVPICVGITAGSTLAACTYARMAVQAGAHSVMLAPTPNSPQDDRSILRQYAVVAEAVDVPVVIQDHPGFTNVRMGVDLLRAICSLSPALKVVKLEAPPTPPKVMRLVDSIPGVVVLGGLGGLMLLEELRHGASGTMTGFAFPEALVEIVSLYHAGDLEAATSVFYRWCPLLRFEGQDALGIPLRKLIYQRRGVIQSAHVRSPAAELDSGTVSDLDDLLLRAPT